MHDNLAFSYFHLFQSKHLFYFLLIEYLKFDVRRHPYNVLYLGSSLGHVVSRGPIQLSNQLSLKQIFTSVWHIVQFISLLVAGNSLLIANKAACIVNDVTLPYDIF